MLDAKTATLLAVAEAKTFSSAAEKLSLTQPAVSHQISQLEEELGTRLFERGRRGLTPTEEGEIVLKYARRMTALEEMLKEELDKSRQQVRRLRVGITHTSESNKVATTLAKYSSEHPGINITIISDAIKNLYTMLDHYELDLAIVDERPRNAAFSSLMLATDYLVCVLSPENPLSRKTQVSIADLHKQKLILRLPGSETRTQMASYLTAIGERMEDFHVIMEVDNIATIKECVKKNLGVSVLARSACTNEVRKKKLVALPMENLSMQRERHVVYRSDFPHVEMVREIFGVAEKGDQKKKKTEDR